MSEVEELRERVRRLEIVLYALVDGRQYAGPNARADAAVEAWNSGIVMLPDGKHVCKWEPHDEMRRLKKTYWEPAANPWWRFWA